MQNQGQILVDKGIFDALVESNKRQQEQIELLMQQLIKLQKMIFGSKHERYAPANANQLSLDMAMGLASTVPVVIEKITYIRKKQGGPSTPNRAPLPENLRREIIDIYPDGDLSQMKYMDYEVTEKLEFTFPEPYVKQYRRHKYAMPDAGVIIGKLPEFILPKGIAGITLICYILTSKFLDHLPYYRLLSILKRYGVTINDATLNDWQRKTIENWLILLFDRLNQLMREQNYQQLDETGIKVMDKDKKGATHQGYFWVSHSPHNKLVVFNYDKRRSATFPTDLLNGFQGDLQTDGYGVYEKFEKVEGITLLGCMAHARRKFTEALGNDKERADYFLTLIQLLYKLERELKNEKATEQVILERREKIAKPILNQLHQWLKDNIIQVTPKSTIGMAIAYSLTRWEKLSRYTEKAHRLIDNNLAENQIRPIAIGRKNFMFCGNHESAKRTGIMYTLFGCCKLNNINPQEWLLDVLEKLPYRKANDIDDLLPHNWINPKVNVV